MSPLTIIKVVHTIVWALMAGAIVTLPYFIVRRRKRWILVLIAIVLVECGVLAANKMRCPLTDMAASYTSDRSANFDIYLPVWIAQYNKVIFGSMFMADLMFAVWLRRKPRTSGMG